MVGLARRQIGLDPYLVSRLQIGHLTDRQGGASARDADVDLRTVEVEACVVGTEGCRHGNGEKAGSDQRELHSLLDARDAPEVVAEPRPKIETWAVSREN